MASRVVPFAPEHAPAVRAFNQRLAAGRIGWRFPEHWVPDWLPKTEHSPIYQEFFVLLEGEAVRGAYVLKHEDVSFRGVVRRVGCFYLPLSEGALNSAYALIATRLMSDARRREPLLYGLGMGGSETQIARLIRAMRWPMQVVPFYFKVRDGSRFLREIGYLRRGRLVSGLLSLAAATGVGALAAHAARLALRRPRTDRGVVGEVVDEFGDWLDELWRRCASRYAFIAVRDSATLNHVYPRATRNALLLKLSRGGQAIGCAVVQEVERSRVKYFGELRVGAIVDGLARPEDAAAVVAGAERVLEERGMDLLVSNQSHPAWRAALRRAGFVRGPSNFMFATAPSLAELLRPIDPNWREIHLNRGDGDVPWPGDRLVPDDWHKSFDSGRARRADAGDPNGPPARG